MKFSWWSLYYCLMQRNVL